MKGKFFAFTSRLKYINRWALMRNTTYENLSQHSGEVATIAHALAVIGNKRLGKEYNAERAALLGLYHDTPEIITGDMPTPVKYYSREMRSVFGMVEKEACQRLLNMLPDDHLVVVARQCVGCGGTDDTTADDCYIIHCSFPPVRSALARREPGICCCTKKERTETKATALVRFAHIS